MLHTVLKIYTHGLARPARSQGSSSEIAGGAGIAMSGWRALAPAVVQSTLMCGKSTYLVQSLQASLGGGIEVEADDSHDSICGCEKSECVVHVEVGEQAG